MKSLQKHPLFETPGLAVLCSYMGEHYTQQERSQLHESLALLPNDLPRIAGFVSSVEWLQEALARQTRPSEAAEPPPPARMLSILHRAAGQGPDAGPGGVFPRHSAGGAVRRGAPAACSARCFPRAAADGPGALVGNLAGGGAPAAQAVGGACPGAGDRHPSFPPSLLNRRHDDALDGRAGRGHPHETRGRQAVHEVRGGNRLHAPQSPRMAGGVHGPVPGGKDRAGAPGAAGQRPPRPREDGPRGGAPHPFRARRPRGWVSPLPRG